jgi:hypothetical protein
MDSIGGGIERIDRRVQFEALDTNVTQATRPDYHDLGAGIESSRGLLDGMIGGQTSIGQGRNIFAIRNIVEPCQGDRCPWWVFRSMRGHHDT